jgi:hypothetical protein
VFSSFFPPPVAVLFFIAHGPRSHRVSPAVRKTDDDCEEISTRIRLSEHIINRILTLRLSSLDQWLTHACLFHFVGADTVPGDMVNSILNPNEFKNPHGPILSSTCLPHVLLRQLILNLHPALPRSALYCLACFLPDYDEFVA